jgi:proteic killer suppression protein
MNRFFDGFYLALPWDPCYDEAMIQYFRSQGTEDIFNGCLTSAAQRACPRRLWKIAARKLDLLDSAVNPIDLRSVFHEESGHGSYRLPIQDSYAVLFTWGAMGPEQVTIVLRS